MTQLNLVTQELGWGNLNSSLKKVKSLQLAVQTAEKKLAKDRAQLSNLVEEINNERRKRVLNLLKKEKRAICLLHRLVFRNSGAEELLVPQEQAEIVSIFTSWTTREGCYDSDKEDVSHTGGYEAIACRNCKDLLSRSCIVDERYVGHQITNVPPKKTKEELYDSSTKILDWVSREYFQMPPVTLENLSSL